MSTGDGLGTTFTIGKSALGVREITSIPLIGNVTPIPGMANIIAVAGQSVQVSPTSVLGGYIVNPLTNIDQGLKVLQNLYVDPTGPAVTSETETTIALEPGQFYTVIPGATVWVNSNSSGHKFTSVNIVAPQQYTPITGPFPPATVTGVTGPIPSYLYQEYSSDDDLQAFVAAYNSMMQDIVDTFNGLNLPIYTQDPISGALLDWVGQGLYGYPRPNASSGFHILLGPYNTAEYDIIEYNEYKLLFPNEISYNDDDFYRRCLTWHFSKREGKYFNIEWLKKRIMKFLYGINGTQPIIDQTYQISITFGTNYEVTIRFVLGIRTIITSAMYNDDSFQYNVCQYNEINTSYVALPNLPYLLQFTAAIKSGVLELPFQFTYDIVIG